MVLAKMQIPKTSHRSTESESLQMGLSNLHVKHHTQLLCTLMLKDY